MFRLIFSTLRCEKFFSNLTIQNLMVWICEKSKFVRFRGVSGKCLKLRDLSANAFFANHLRCRMFCDCHIIHTVLSLVTGLMLG